MENWYRKPGHKNLLVYKLAVMIFDLTEEFCRRLIDKRSRTYDQMIQAARSGKQNIVEGSLEKSLKGYIKLLGVSRASYGELQEDYADFLRIGKMTLWDKEDQRVQEIRRIRIGDWANSPNSPNWPNLKNWPSWANTTNLAKSPESFANLLITLINMESYLLDKMLQSLEGKFTRGGGYTENLFRKRINYRYQNK